MNDNKKNNGNSQQNDMPVVDENWWESVLADEVKYVPYHQKMEHDQAHSSEKAYDHAEPKSVQIDWDLVRQEYKSDRIIEINVVGHNRGGLLVEGSGFSGFVPCSHLIELAGKEIGDERDINLEEYVGKSLNVKIIECKPDEERIVFSERAALSEPGKRVELFDTLEVGMQVTGTVTNITDFGVFVDLGGVEGLIHISELSWGRVSHPKQIVQLGDDVEVQVLEISAERCRVALSRKRLLPNPWENAAVEFPEGKEVTATIVNVLSYGAFANLDFGVEGLIHATEMPLEEGQSPRDILSEGQRVQLRVLHVDARRQRLGFSMLMENK
ncbi:MAG TPA: S1 RNA-binding domain-containing protein [Anaerolineales bacterium]|nr:S1 RNA-binding domain-containing protein [Anaerolineales bacterium]